jgi:hypothetical protein
MRTWTLLGAIAVTLSLAQTRGHGGEVKELMLVDGKLSHTVPLTKADDKVDGKPAKVYAVKLVKDKKYQIDLMHLKKKGGDPYLVLKDSTGKELARDDDGGGGLNARIVFTCPEDGLYRIVCTSFAGQFGTFILRIAEK